jgi:3,4-dihydroxy-2-butanone 4-phosphate synthase
MVRRGRFGGTVADADVIQQCVLRRQGHALASTTLAQAAGRIGQSFGVVAVHGRSGRVRRRRVDREPCR